MRHWIKRVFVAAAPLLLTSCLWGPGKFNSDLTLKKDGSFVLDYHGEMVLQVPKEEATAEPWKNSFARCFKDGELQVEANGVTVVMGTVPEPESKSEERPCTPAEIAKLKVDYDKQAADKAASKRKESEEVAKMFGLPGLDDASNRAFAAKLMKFAGWRSVTYAGKGVFNVDYHFEGRATQDFLFPALPDNNLLIPFIALRRRADGSVLVTAPAFTGGSGPMGAAARGDPEIGRGPVSRAQGRFTIVTNGEILTNNSEDGAAAHPIGRQLHWDVGPSSTKIPETLIRL